MSPLHASTKPVAAGTDTREGSDARQRSTPAATTIAAPLSPPSVEQPATDARPLRASVATIHQHARDAAAEVAYPREKYGVKTGTIWATSTVTGRAHQRERDLSWVTDKANCIGQTDTMFPSRGASAAANAKAKAICAGCPLLEPCRQYGLKHEYLDGVWGALSVEDRRRIRRHGGSLRPPGRPHEPIEHGTNAGFIKHYRFPDRYGQPCDACRRARSVYEAGRKRVAS